MNCGCEDKNRRLRGCGVIDFVAMCPKCDSVGPDLSTLRGVYLTPATKVPYLVSAAAREDFQEIWQRDARAPHRIVVIRADAYKVKTVLSEPDPSAKAVHNAMRALNAPRRSDGVLL